MKRHKPPFGLFSPAQPGYVVMSTPTLDASASTLGGQDVGLQGEPLVADVSGKSAHLFEASLTSLESLMLLKPTQHSVTPWQGHCIVHHWFRLC